jgi:hypothetical protein
VKKALNKGILIVLVTGNSTFGNALKVLKNPEKIIVG